MPFNWTLFCQMTNNWCQWFDRRVSDGWSMIWPSSQWWLVNDLTVDSVVFGQWFDCWLSDVWSMMTLNWPTAVMLLNWLPHGMWANKCLWLQLITHYLCHKAEECCWLHAKTNWCSLETYAYLLEILLQNTCHWNIPNNLLEIVLQNTCHWNIPNNLLELFLQITCHS